MSKGELFLIPTTISENTSDAVIPHQSKNELHSIRHFLVEDLRTARRYLSNLKLYDSIEGLSMEVLNKDTAETRLKTLFEPVLNGHNLGVMSESGCPGIADPGSLAVKYAHAQGIRVRPLVGPSSILLALMASGLNGQRFAFHGYLPIEKREVLKAIKDLEKESIAKNQTQIFIETPYRNNVMMDNLIKTLRENTLLCRGIDLTGSSEDIKTTTVKAWKNSKENLPKLPCIFLFLAS